jgi:hypothetical protein
VSARRAVLRGLLARFQPDRLVIDDWAMATPLAEAERRDFISVRLRREILT